MADRVNAVSYIECSAKTRENVNHVFAQAARVSLTYQRRKKSAKSINPPASTRRRCLIQ